MALAITNFIPNYFQADRVAVFTQDYTQVFQNARAIKAVVKEVSKAMEHPLENGSIITDHRIILPVEIELSMILSSEDYVNVYNSIRQYYLNGTLLVVQTYAGVFFNQLIASMPHQEDPDQFNALSLSLNLKQVLFAQAEFNIVPAKASNSNSVARGTQSPTMPSASVAANGFDYFKNSAKSFLNKISG